MQIIVNRDIPKQALAKLAQLGEVINMYSHGITYPAISGHPDVFFCHVDNMLIAAPNIPKEIIVQLNRNNIDFVEGHKVVGNSYPDTAHYNAVVTDKYLIHNLKTTDPRIVECCDNKVHIHVNQAYTRCNLLCLGDDMFITSDVGIYSTLRNISVKVLYVDPEEIELPEFKNGFFGGVCGVFKKHIYIIGSLNYHKDKTRISDFLKNANYTIVELYNGPLYDGGSIFFVQD